MMNGEDIARALGPGWVFEPQMNAISGRSNEVWLRFKADFQIIISVDAEQAKVAMMNMGPKGPLVYVSWPRADDRASREETVDAIQRAVVIMKDWIGVLVQ